MKKNGKYYRQLMDFDNPGHVKEVECTEHSYAWSGETPCTGIRVCVHCGKRENDREAKNV